MVFKEFGQREEATVGLRPWHELDEEVHIAVRMRLATQDGSKQGEAGHPQSANLRFALGQPLNGLLAGENGRWHGHRVSVMGRGANNMTERPNVRHQPRRS